MKKKQTHKALLLSSLILLFVGLFRLNPIPKSPFQAETAFRVLAKLQENGPRTPGSVSHALARKFIANFLTTNGWLVKIQSGNMLNNPVHNIIATRSSSHISTVLASHYDSRLFANNDPNQKLRSLPVPGANDGGSSTAVLLELSRILAPSISSDIAFVFFDAEDQGNIAGWDWILGSRLFVQQLQQYPAKMILLDMVGGFDQKIIPPVNSDIDIYNEIQAVAADIGYADNFPVPGKHGILDDHVPFLEIGVPAVDLIDIVDPRWHTTADDLENVSSQSLQRIGDTLFLWILSHEKP